jgi:hypothetical protein
MPGLPSAPKQKPLHKPLLPQARKAKEIDEKTYRIKALLVGPSGGAKSTLAATVPGRKLVVDLDQRSESLVGMPDVDIIEIGEPDIDNPTAYDKLVQVKDELWDLANAGELPYDAVIIDGYTRLGRYAMYKSLQLTDAKGQKMSTMPGGGPAQPHYSPQMTWVVNISMQMFPLPCHVIFTGHVDIYEDKLLNTISFYPKITGKIRTEVSSWFNETYLCEYSPSQGKYLIHTLATRRYDFLKTSLNRTGVYWESPVEFDLTKEPCGFADLMRRRFHRKEA